MPICFCLFGHVDTGKSTIAGHLYYLCGGVDEHAMDNHRKECAAEKREYQLWSSILDIHRSERERGKTSEFSALAFAHGGAAFELIDTPGHKVYITEMIAGMAAYDPAAVVGCLVVSARQGEFASGWEAAKDDLLIIRALGIERLLVLVNKMDEAGWRAEAFAAIADVVAPFARKTCRFASLAFVPLSGREGAGLLAPGPLAPAPPEPPPSLLAALRAAAPEGAGDEGSGGDPSGESFLRKAAEASGGGRGAGTGGRRGRGARARAGPPRRPPRPRPSSTWRPASCASSARACCWLAASSAWPTLPGRRPTSSSPTSTPSLPPPKAGERGERGRAGPCPLHQHQEGPGGDPLLLPAAASPAGRDRPPGAGARAILRSSSATLGYVIINKFGRSQGRKGQPSASRG